MPTPVLMPQMGESITEGTIVRWMKQVGDRVDRDEPLFEISTDKVDAEIPAPVEGVLVEIAVKAGETVPVDSVVATINAVGEAVSVPAPAAVPERAAAVADQGAASASREPVTPPHTSVSTPGGPAGPDELRRQKSSPLVRRIAREHNVDISHLAGSGASGRVTKRDITGYLDGPAARAGQTPPPGAAVPAYQPGERVELQPLSVIRRKIAHHMVLSRRTAAHVHTVFHVNFSRVESIRRERKAQYESAGVKLTYMAFIAKACVDALREHPIVNASFDAENIVYKQDINIGVAVALDSGLIVPVIKQAGEKNMLGLSRAIADVADRARARQLKPDEVHGGTFTITNPGQSGAQFGLPIINQPQVAILCVGTIEKRPVVVDDALAIRTMAYLTLGFDHRLIDGAVADAFMADVKYQIENFDPGQV